MRRFSFHSKRRVIVAALGAVTVLAIAAPLAAAAFIAETTSSEQVAAGTYSWSITGGGAPSSGPAALYPGLGPQVFTFSVNDTGTLRALFLDSELSATVTAHAAGCPSSDFVTSMNTNGATGTTLDPSEHASVTVSVALNTAITENACEGTTPTVTLTITGSD